MGLPSRGQKINPVKISHERLMFMQADTHPSNFGIDERGNTVLMDFGNVGVLPESFVTFKMNSGLVPIMESRGLLRNPNSYSMAVISSVLWMMAGPTLGASICAGCGFH